MPLFVLFPYEEDSVLPENMVIRARNNRDALQKACDYLSNKGLDVVVDQADEELWIKVSGIIQRFAPLEALIVS